MHRRKIKYGLAVVISIVAVVLLMKDKTLIRRFLSSIGRYKNLGLDSIKDFLEINEIGLKFVYSEKGIRLEWNDDESKSYTLVLSNDYISKSTMLNLQEIKDLESTPIEDVDKWIRKIETITTHINLELEDEIATLHCRLISENGRMSRSIEYSDIAMERLEMKQEEIKLGVKAWSLSSDRSNLIVVEKTDDSVNDLMLKFFADGSSGLTRDIPDFDESITIDLGDIDPCLCFISGTLRGKPFEYFVSWIGEEKALIVDEHLPDLL